MTSVKCAIRVRPFSPKETMDKTKNIIEMSGPTTTITDPSWFERKENLDAITAEDTEYLYKKSFTFDHSFWSFNGNDNHFSSQENIFEHLGTFVLDNALNAFNCSIFAYGQTGSGKSYSMMGTGGEMSKHIVSEQRGLIPRICEALFNRVDNNNNNNKKKSSSNNDKNTIVNDNDYDSKTSNDKNTENDDDKNTENENDDIQWTFAVTYLEIYQERVYDLLSSVEDRSNNNNNNNKNNIIVDNPRNLRIREHPTKGAYAEGLNECVVKNYKDVEHYIYQGSKARTVASTNMNLESSRSHAVFTIILKSNSKKKGLRSDCCVRLVDLAGSERAKKSGATGERLKEGSNINKSLSALSEVIKALANRSENNRKKALGEGGDDHPSTNFIPYRNSTLTWLLKESLGGNAKTVMLATVSPADYHYEETLSTLKYVERAKKIISNVTQNQIRTSSEQISMLKKEVERLKAQLRSGGIAVDGDDDDDLTIIVEEKDEHGNIIKKTKRIQKTNSSSSSSGVGGGGRYGVLIKEINDTKEKYKSLRLKSENDLKLKKEAYRQMIEKLRSEHDTEEKELKKHFKETMKQTQVSYKTEISNAIKTIQDLKNDVSSKDDMINKRTTTINNLKKEYEASISKMEKDKINKYEKEIETLKLKETGAGQTFETEIASYKEKEKKYKVEIKLGFDKINELKLEKMKLNDTIASQNKTIEELIMKLENNNTMMSNNNEKEVQAKEQREAKIDHYEKEKQEILSTLNIEKEKNNILKSKLEQVLKNEARQIESVEKLTLQIQTLMEEKQTLNDTVVKYSQIIDKLKKDMNNTIMGTVTTMRGEFTDEMIRVEEENAIKLEEMRRKADKRLEKERKDHRKSEEMLQDTIIGLTKKVKEASNKVVEGERRHEQQIAEWEERLLKAQMQTAEAMNFQVAVSRGEKDWSWVEKASNTVKRGIKRYTGQEESEEL